MDTQYIQLKGRLNIPESLALGQDYHVAITGSIQTRRETDNHDGTHSHIWVLEPLELEILKANGESVKADRTKKSQKLRNRLFAIWQTSQTQDDFPEWYEKSMNYFIANADMILLTEFPKV